MTEASSKARLGGGAPVLALVSTKTTFMDFFWGGESTYCYNIPLEVNLLLGEKKSKCEAGLGVNVGLYNDQYDITLPTTNSKGDVKFKTVQEKKNKVDAFAYLNIGYRHVANNGFVFRAGVTPLVILTNSRNNGGKMGFVPYISLGKAF